MSSHSCSALMKTCAAQLNPVLLPIFPGGRPMTPSQSISPNVCISPRSFLLCILLFSLPSQTSTHAQNTSEKTTFHTILQPHNYSYSSTELPPPKLYWEKTIICFSESQKASTNFKYQDTKHTNFTSSVQVLTSTQISPTWKIAGKSYKPRLPSNPFNTAPLKKL